MEYQIRIYKEETEVTFESFRQFRIYNKHMIKPQHFEVKIDRTGE